MLKKAFLIAALLTSNYLFAKTQMSELVSYVQNKYASSSKSHPILIFDKDEINWRFAKGKAFSDEKKRFAIIKSYVKEKTGTELTDNEASNYDTYLSILKNSAVALPLTEGYYSQKKVKICGVFHADPNSNQRLEAERLLGLATKEAYGDLKYQHLNEKLEFEEMKKFSLYHELGHCLDKKYLPKAQESYDDAHSIHESESFAETTGLLLLAKEGMKNVADRRIIMRNIYSRKMGEYFIKTPGIGYGNPNVKYGGLIYYMEPVLKAGQEIVESGEIGSLEELLDTSERIVEKNALHSRVFNAIYTYFVEGEEVALQRYRDYEESMPEIFSGTVDKMLSYVDSTGLTLENSFDPSRPEIPFRRELLGFKVEHFCSSFLNNDRDSFDRLLDEYRLDLKQENGTAPEQRTRQQELMDLHENLVLNCTSEE